VDRYPRKTGGTDPRSRNPGRRTPTGTAVTDDLLDGLPPAASAAVRQVAEELIVRESMIFPDGREFTGEPPGLCTVQ
jgi:hypothetical protein